MTIVRHDRPDMPGASIAGRQLATVFRKYFASLPPVRKTPARDHQTGLRSPKPVTLRTADAGYRSEANLKTLAGADISALITGNGMRERDGRGKTSDWTLHASARRNVATQRKMQSQVHNIERSTARQGKTGTAGHAADQRVQPEEIVPVRGRP